MEVRKRRTRSRRCAIVVTTLSLRNVCHEAIVSGFSTISNRHSYVLRKKIDFMHHRNPGITRSHTVVRNTMKESTVSDIISSDSVTSQTNSLDHLGDKNNRKERDAFMSGENDFQKDNLFASMYDGLIEKIGKVDDSKYSFPEVATGEMPRLFSNLSYKKIQTNDKVVMTASHVAGSTLAAAALVAGTTIGAGVLALPSVTAPAGFLPSSVALLVAWCYMTMSGLLISELVINRIGQTGKTGIGILELYSSSLPGPLGYIGNTAYFFLHYAVMVAYISQGGYNLGSVLDSLGLSFLSSIPGFDQVLYALSVGLVVYATKQPLSQLINNVLVFGMIISFASIIAVGIDSADFNALVAPQNQHPELVVNAFPILFLAMVYQNVVPTIVTQLECDRSKIITAIIGGTTIPLIMYLAWNAVILGNVMSLPDVLNGNLDPIDLLQSEGHAGPLLSGLVTTFSSLAVTTSFIGFVYGIVNGLSDILRSFTEIDHSNNKAEGVGSDRWKPALYAAAIIPPLALSIGDPDLFINALSYGGAFGVSTLFLILPPLMTWKMRYGSDDAEKKLSATPMVPFGKIPLASMWKAAATLIVEQGAEKLGLIDFVQKLIGQASN